jgi:hypothetical protein
VYSWVADLLPKAVYLLITGPPESGKTTLVDTLRLFCRRGLSADDITPAALSQACSLISPTLMIDEFDLDHGSTGRGLQRLLRAGSSRGHAVLRKNFGAEVYGAKVICCENPPDDSALASRCIAIRMMEHDTSRLKKPSDSEMVQLSREIQGQLLQWRFENYRSIQPAKVSGAERLNPRERDLLAALAAPFAGDQDWCDLLLQSFQATGQTLQRSLAPDEAAVLDGLFAVTHRNDVFLQMSVGELTRHMFEIYKAAGQAVKLEPRAVGAILDKFVIARTRKNSGWMFFVHNKTRERVHELAKKYGLNIPLESLGVNSSVTCQYCDRIWPPYTPPSSDDPDLKD